MPTRNKAPLLAAFNAFSPPEGLNWQTASPTHAVKQPHRCFTAFAFAALGRLPPGGQTLIYGFADDTAEQLLPNVDSTVRRCIGYSWAYIDPQEGCYEIRHNDSRVFVPCTC